jgi:F-type H+-transporting ATPase subunit delta
MASLRIARRYATALLELAAEAGVHERIYEELQGVAAVLRASGELRAVLRNPVIRTERKRAILEELFAGRVSELLLQFLRLLVEKRREPLLPDIIVAYEELFFEHTNRLAVIARSAIPLDEELQERVTQILSERTGKQVLLRPEVRPELLGGLQIQIGDTVYDGTLQHALQRLRQQLLQELPTHHAFTASSPSTDHLP